MIVKYYSEKLDRCFDTEEECIKAEGEEDKVVKKLDLQGKLKECFDEYLVMAKNYCDYLKSNELKNKYFYLLNEYQSTGEDIRECEYGPNKLDSKLLSIFKGDKEEEEESDEDVETKEEDSDDDYECTNCTEDCDNCSCNYCKTHSQDEDEISKILENLFGFLGVHKK